MTPASPPPQQDENTPWCVACGTYHPPGFYCPKLPLSPPQQGGAITDATVERLRRNCGNVALWLRAKQPENIEALLSEIIDAIDAMRAATDEQEPR